MWRRRGIAEIEKLDRSKSDTDCVMKSHLYSKVSISSATLTGFTAVFVQLAPTQCDLCKQALRQVRKQSQNHFYIILVKYISVVLKSKYVDFLKRIVKNNFSSFLAIFQNSATVTLDGFFPDRIFLNEEGSVFLSKWPACKVFQMPIPHIYLTCMPTGSPTFWITLFVFPPTIEKGLIPQHVFM